MSRRRRPAPSGPAPGGFPDRPEGRPDHPAGRPDLPAGRPDRPAGRPDLPAGRPDLPEGPGRPGGAGRLRPLLVWLVPVGVLIAAVLGLRLGAGDVELLVRAPLWLVTAQAGGILLGAAALVAAVRARGARDARLARVRSEEEARTRHRQFLRRLDHELKNPLTAVRAAVADASPGAPPGVVVNLEVVDAQSRRMSRLLTDLRKLAELETASLALEDVDLAETVTDAVGAVMEEAAGRGAAVRLRLDLPRVPWPLPHVRGDGDLLYSAVYNIVSNAVKYTPAGGAVEVRGREEGGTVTIEVADTGIGVPEREMGLVFRELGRAGNARALPGSGLGLPLVRTIAQRHGGNVGMASREGVGTRVWLVLPVAGPGPARAA